MRLPLSLILRLAAVAALAAACRRDAPRLDDVQKMAYQVKPAVVRVNSLATGVFRYTRGDILDIQTALRVAGRNVTPASLPESSAQVDTGAGGSGSGFIIHPSGSILTNGHVVEATRDGALLERDLRRNGAIAALVRHYPLEELRALYRDELLDRYVDAFATVGEIASVHVVNEVELSNGETLPFTILRFSPSLAEGGSDLALLRINRKDLPALKLGDSDLVGVGESIWSVGYPAVANSTDEVIGGWLSRDSDLEATFNPGTITAIRRNVANAPVFQSNVAIYHGNSGGPAVNRNGEVIGISTWGHTIAEQIKFLVPINAAKAFVSSSGIPLNVDGEFNRIYRAALDEAANGQWESVKANVAAASRLFPNSPDLIRLRHDADRALSRGAASSRLEMVATAAATAVLLGGAVLSGVLFARRRRPLPETDGPIAAIVARDGVAASHEAMIGRFTILNGDRAGQKLGLGGSGIRIGRESGICEIVLENPKVSRLHAEVVSIDGKVLLIDRNSSNGTYVNDQKIDRRYLKDGDIIHFGGRNAIAVAFHA